MNNVWYPRLISDERFCKAILLVDERLKIHIFPETTESVAHLHEKLSTIYLHLIDQDAKTIKGFMLQGGKQTGKEVAAVTEVWSVKFPDDQQIHKIGKQVKALFIFPFYFTADKGPSLKRLVCIFIACAVYFKLEIFVYHYICCLRYSI